MIRTARPTFIILIGVIVWAGNGLAFSQTSSGLRKTGAGPQYPNYQRQLHDVGQVSLMINNWGAFGNMNWLDYQDNPGSEYPQNSELYYLGEGSLWIGGIKSNDTLVSASVGPGNYVSREVSEFSPPEGLQGAIHIRSSIRSSEFYDEDAISEQDFICTYTDTLKGDFTGEDSYDNRGHIPLGVGIREGSYAWSYDYAAKSILVDYQITNLDTLPILDMFVGFAVLGSVFHLSNVQYGASDDLNGFLRTTKGATGSCREVDTLDFAWCADNDGDPNASGEWDFASPRGVSGIRILRPRPGDSLTLNYNWWFTHTDPALSFGPRRSDPFRRFPRDLASPTGDVIKYYVLSHPEIDYDQMFTSIDHQGEGFMPPPPASRANDISDGYPVNYLLSIGPFDLEPGDTLPLTLAYVVGDNFHVNPTDFQDYFAPGAPQIYYDKLDFTDLADNARWAEYIYDNPGWDTDGDGNAGLFMWQCTCGGESFCLDETVTLPDSLVGCCRKEYYRGDGVPDFRPASPPPPPVVRTIPEMGRVTIRWNGKDSEEYIDFLTGEPGFEGYRVYMANDDRLTDFVMLASYDIEDYSVIRFNPSGRQWEGARLGVPIDSLRKQYGPVFDPTEYYDEMHYFTDPRTGDILYFVPQDWNRSDATDLLGIHRIYPDASPDNPGDVTEEGYQRCYEYEYTIDNLQPSVPYYFAVTAFNKGSFHRSLHVMETSPQMNAVREYALPGSEQVETRGLNVIVYPNPYRISDHYARTGYENRDRTKTAAWARRVHFANLPPVCTIRIYTLSGDLVQQIDHYRPDGGPNSQHEEWNMISRNTQAVVTGIYLWSVTSAMGEQLGKLVIIK